MAASQACVRAMGEEYCVHHPKQKLIFECKNCDSDLACISCVSSVHQGHIMVELSTTVEEKIVKINSFIKHTKEKSLPDLVKEIKMTFGTLYKKEREYQSEIKEVKKQEKQLIAAVKLEYASKTARLQFLLKDTTELLNKHKVTLEKIHQDLEKDTKEYEQTVKSGSDALVHDVQACVVGRLHQDTPKLPVMTTATFRPCKDTATYIAKAFGEILEEMEGSGTMKTAQVTHVTSEYTFLDQPKVLFESFSLPNFVKDICLTPNNNIWTVTFKSQLSQLDRFDHEGQIQQSLQFDSMFFKICSHPTTWELYTCVQSDNSIRRINTQSRSTSILFHTDSKPWGIGCTNDRRIVVSMKGGAITKYDFNGQVLNTCYTCTGGYIREISVCSKTNKVALTGGYAGTVKILDDSLRELYEYKGQGPKQKFYLSVAAFDDKYLLVGDRENNEIHVLDNGELVHTITIKDIDTVKVMSVHQPGVIYAGGWNSNKLLCVKYIE